jgi:hypothetical protein
MCGRFFRSVYSATWSSSEALRSAHRHDYAHSSVAYRAATADGAAVHVGEQIAAAGWNLDSGPVFGEVSQPGRFGAFSLKPGFGFCIIGRAVAPSTPRSGGRPGQGI